MDTKQTSFETLDPRVRLFWMFSLSAIALHFHTVAPLLVVIATLVPIWALSGRVGFMIRRVSIRLIPFLAFLAVIQMLTAWISHGTPWSVVTMQTVGTQILRVYIMITASVLLWETTSFEEVSEAIRCVKRGIEKSRWNSFVESLAFAVGMAFQFVPVVKNELDTMIAVRRARGEGITEGGSIAQARKMVRMGVPLLSRVFEYIKNLMLALLNYSYSPFRPRTQYVRLRYNWQDWIATTCIVVYAVMAFSLPA